MSRERETEGVSGVETPDDQMTTFSLHSFGKPHDNHNNHNHNHNDGFTLQIIENMREEYGMFVWPCSVVLAEYVWQHRSRFSAASVTELGAGTSLPGLVAAKVGADVTLTDDSNRLEVLENIRRVCDLNNLSCKVMGLTWGVWDAQIFDLHPQILLGADVLYDTSAFDDLFSTVAFLLQSSPGSVFITTYHNRSQSQYVSTRDNSRTCSFYRLLCTIDDEKSMQRKVWRSGFFYFAVPKFV